jgi:hypothetical protein
MWGDTSTGAFDSKDVDMNNRLGAGKANMRALTNPSLDAPFYWNGGWTCVNHGTTVHFPIEYSPGSPPDTIPADVDRLRVVAWFYDKRFAENSSFFLDNINIVLRDHDTGAQIAEDSLNEHGENDNKLRLQATGAQIGGRKLRVDFVGATVSNDEVGCGANSMKVFFAILFEDNDRDDSDGPGYSFCLGAAPLL